MDDSDLLASGMRRPRSRLALAGLVVAVLAAVCAALAGFGHRWRLWSYGAGFTGLRWAAYIGIAGAVLSLLGMIRARPGGSRRGFGAALLGLVLGGAVFYLPYAQLQTARSVPPIHDITTDTQDPPQFSAVLPLRKADGATNSTDYGAAEVAQQQKEAYPDIVPAHLDEPPDQAFQRALDAARQMGWDIDASEPQQGRIEATATTFWFGFKDDVVIRVRPDQGGSRVDVRSESRVGRSDIGTNARRIRQYLGILQGAA